MGVAGAEGGVHAGAAFGVEAAGRGAGAFVGEGAPADGAAAGLDGGLGAGDAASSNGANCATESAHAGVVARHRANVSKGFRARFIRLGPSVARIS